MSSTKNDGKKDANTMAFQPFPVRLLAPISLQIAGLLRFIISRPAHFLIMRGHRVVGIPSKQPKISALRHQEMVKTGLVPFGFSEVDATAIPSPPAGFDAVPDTPDTVVAAI